MTRLLRFALVLNIVILFAVVVPADFRSPVVRAAPSTATNYAAAMRAPFAAEANRPDLPHYDLAMTVDPAKRRLQGHLDLQFSNMTGTALRDVVLRLIPNFPRDIFGDGGNGDMRVSNVTAGGADAAHGYEAGRSAVRITLPAAAPAGSVITIALDWSASVERWVGSDDSLPLPSYYPQLSVWNGGWRTDVTRFPDRVYATSSLYHATIGVPQGWGVVSSGTVVGTTKNGGLTTTEVVTGPVREFAFTVGKFAVAESGHEGTTIRVYYRTGTGLGGAAAQIAEHAAASLAVFNDRYGPYPFRNLNFHLLNAGRGFDAGVEYPGLIFILLNRRYTAETRFVTAHEVAHQWFYGLLGDDIFREPWLDEAFAQFSPLLVEERWAGPVAVDNVYEREIARRSRAARLPAGLALTDYGSWNTYYASVYGRGADFLYTLRKELGDPAFFAGLQDYFRTHKYGIVHTDDARAAWERSSGKDLRPIFRKWVGRE